MNHNSTQRSDLRSKTSAYARTRKAFFALLAVSCSTLSHAQASMWGAVNVNTAPGNYNIGQANTTRNVATDAFGNIYIVTAGSTGVNLSKSTDRGQTFSAPVLIDPTTNSSEPEIHVAANNNIYVAYYNGSNSRFAYSTNLGASFTATTILGATSAAHIASYQNMVYVLRTNGQTLYRNDNYGVGTFSTTTLGSYAFSDVFTDPNTGEVTLMADNPNLFAFKSNDNGVTFSAFTLASGWLPIQYSSYAQSIGSLGKFIFVAGGGVVNLTQANRIDMTSGITTTLTFQSNPSQYGRTLLADEFGNLVDGYADGTNVYFRHSADQGMTWAPTVTVGAASTHNIARNNFYSDIVVVSQTGNTVHCNVYGGVLKTLNIPSVTTTVICQGNSIQVPYSSPSVFTSTNDFRVELSDNTGSFATPKVIGVTTSSVSGTITATFPGTLTAGGGYRIRVTSTSPILTGNPYPGTFSVAALPVVTANASTLAVCLGNSVTLNGGGATSYTWTGGVSNNVAFAPSASGPYTVTGANTIGCRNTASLSVTVHTLPVISVNSGSICAGKTFTMVPSGAVTYTYSNGSNTVSPANTASYTVIGTNANGCVSTTSAVANVTVNALPVISVNSGSICVGATFTMNPSGAVTYTYSNGSNTVTPANTSSYTVIGTDAKGCVSTTSAVANVTVNALPVIGVNSGSICLGQTFTMTPAGAVTYTYSSGSNTVSPVNTASYTVIGTDANNCVSTVSAVAHVTVNTLPVISVNSGSICLGQTFTMTPAGAVTYTYSNGSNTVSPVNTSSYTVMGTDANGCISPVSAVSDVTVHALPVISVNSGSICAGKTFTMVPSGAVTYTYSNGSNTVSPANTTSYTVIGTDANGCISSVPAVSDVTVNALPVISVNSGSICAGDVFTMIPSGAVSYTYSNGSNTVSPANTSSYTVTGTGANGCVSGAAVSNVTVHALPTLTTSSSASVICVTESATLNVGGALTYSWSTGETTPEIAVTLTTTTSYTITGTDANGCENMSVLTQSVSECTGFKTLASEPVISLYPNPNTGAFTINAAQPVTITILNAVGQLVSTHELQAGKNQVELNTPAKGIYFVRFKQDNTIKTIKMIAE